MIIILLGDIYLEYIKLMFLYLIPLVEFEEVYELNKPDEALYIGPHVWRISFEHSTDSVLLVLSSFEYNEQDYIRDYDKFLKLVRR